MVQLNERENQVAEAEMYELKQARYIVVNGIFQKICSFKTNYFDLVLTNTKSISTQPAKTWHP